MNVHDRFKPIALPILLLAVGVGWLLTVQQVLPGVNWAWVLGLATAGVVLLLATGIDRVTVVAGPFLIASALFALLRQAEILAVDTEAPLLMIVIGALLICARTLDLGEPNWLEPPRRTEG